MSTTEVPTVVPVSGTQKYYNINVFGQITPNDYNILFLVIIIYALSIIFLFLDLFIVKNR